MSAKKIGYALIALGTFGVIASIIVDFIGLGEGGIQAAQILGILTGMVLLAFGFALALLYPEKQFRLREGFRAAFERFLDLPVSVWVVVGFLLAFILFYLMPVFLNPQHIMVYFNRYIPNKNPIGLDLELTTGNVFSWVTTRQSPYPEQIYPPLTYILLAPFTLLKYPLNFAIATYLTFFAYVILAALTPIMFGGRKDYSLVMLFFITGLFSYGFQFELERGQYYTVTFLLCIVSIYFFHKHRQLRYFAYLLFSISVQLKIIPVYLIFMLIEDWRDWKSNIKRMIGLFLFNFALLFVLGYTAFRGFLEAILNYMKSPLSQWNGNHSLKNFVFTFSQDGFGLVFQNNLAWLQKNSSLVERLLMVIIAVCFLSIIVHAYRTKTVGFNPYLLLASTLVALIIPVSVDYTLPLLVAPMAIFFNYVTLANGSKIKKLFSILLVVVMSLAYASTLYPFKYKPYYLNNMFPPLLIILITVTLLYFLRGREINQNANISEPTISEKAIV